MSTPSARTSGWTQPDPLGTDHNLHPAHRKFGSGPRPATGAPLAAPPAPAATPAPAAAVVEELPTTPPGATAGASAPAGAGVDAPAEAGARTGSEADAADLAHERRLAKQWEDVIARLCRDLAPAGGADRKRVLARISQQRTLLDSATVRDYLPVLVDRAVRRMYAGD